MRPRQYAAEYIELAATLANDVDASMRPRQYAAEYGFVRNDGVGVVHASMRPRQYAAEYLPAPPIKIRNRKASMRPRQYAAEYREELLDIAAGGRAGFNEAAAICRGIPSFWNGRIMELLRLQ